MPRGEKNRFQKGNPGRPKGSPDIRREFKNLRDLLIEMNFDPREAIIELAKHDDEKIRLKALDIIMQRLEPSLKSIEHTGDVKVNYDVVFLKDKMGALLDKNKKDI